MANPSYIHPELYIKLTKPQECNMCRKPTVHAEDVGVAAPLCSKDCAARFWGGYWGVSDDYDFSGNE